MKNSDQDRQRLIAKLTKLGLAILLASSGALSLAAELPLTVAADWGLLSNYAYELNYSPQSMQYSLNNEICFNLNRKIESQAEACNSNLNNLKNNSNFGNFDAKLMIKESVNAYKISYTTPGVDGETRLVSGAILIPTSPAKSIKGIVLFFHGTETKKDNVPSNFTAKNSAYYGRDLAAIFAAQGYIVVAPDYIGLGDDKEILHPYVDYPEVNTDSGMYMLKATRKLLAELGIVSLTKNLSLYSSGYSEGGNYALWSAHSFNQAPRQEFLAQNHLKLKKIAPLSGAYDLSNAQMPFEWANSSMESNVYNISDPISAFLLKPILVSYTLSSFAYYAYQKNFTALFQDNFFNLLNVNPINAKKYNIYTLISSQESQPGNNEIIGLLSKQSTYMLNPQNNQRFAIGSDSIYALIESSLLQNPIFISHLKASSKLDWETKVPLQITYLQRDSVVTNLNATNAYQAVNAHSIAGLVHQQVINNRDFTILNPFRNSLTEIDHTEAMQLTALSALNFFNQQ